MPNNDIREEITSDLEESEDIEPEDVEEFTSIFDANYADLEYGCRQVTLNRMQISNYKAIEDIDISLQDRSTILYGRNSKGKSSFIEATRFNLLGRRRENPIVTNPIRREAERVETTGWWQRDDEEYWIFREMENGGGYTGFNEPVIIENPSENEKTFSERDSQAEVNDLIGISPLVKKRFDRFNIFSLFCVMSGGFKDFVQWDDSADFMDLLFGINLSSVTRAIETEIERTRPSTEMKEAGDRKLEGEARANRFAGEIRELKQDREQLEKTISDKKGRLDELRSILENKSEIDSLLTEQIDLRSEISDLQSKLDDKRVEFQTVKQEISKLEDERVTEELGPALQEIKNLMAIPDRCPICTNRVDSDQQKRFADHGDCPLCGKTVPGDRIDEASEVDEEGELIEHQKRQEELEELGSDRRKIQGELEFLDDQLSEKREELETLQRQIDESDFKEYTEERDRLESEVNDLRPELVSVESSLEAKEGMLHEAAREYWRLIQMDEERYQRETRVSKLEEFQSIVSDRRRDARRALKTRLRRRMEELLEYFTEGTFGPATGVEISEGKTYDYTIYTQNREHLDIDLLGEKDAEIALHMLVFHTAVLSELEKEEDTIPLRLVLIDSPYANEPDDGNKEDIANFLHALPDVLESYQLLITMTDSTLNERSILKEAYSTKNVGEYTS